MLYFCNRNMTQQEEYKYIAEWFAYLRKENAGIFEVFYGIADREEGEDYLLHPTLNDRIHEISTALLEHQDKSAEEIFGGLDAMKVRSSMTLFDELSPNDVFAKVLDVFYHGERDEKTLELLEEE